MDILYYILRESLFFFNEVAIYLLFGFIMAGALHVLFPESIVRRHLGHRTFRSALKSTLFGIPIPLCSCGVVPVAASMRNSGASRGATVSFLIATPQVGADSFMITYSLLGWVFALFRIAAALLTAITAGIAVNLIGGNDGTRSEKKSSDLTFEEGFKLRLKSIFSYTEYELLGSISNALLVGLAVAGIIAALIPDGFFERYFASDFLSMILMLVAGIPMYVCASASTPIAASLIMKGISPGAALVFLLTGPATNAITISTVLETLGRKTAFIYISSIALISLLLGYLLNLIAGWQGLKKTILLDHHEMLPDWLKLCGSIAVAAMLGWYYLKTRVLNKTNEKEDTGEKKTSLNVQGMTCMHCASNIRKAVESVTGISCVSVDLDAKRVEFKANENDSLEEVKAAIRLAGYNV